MPRGLVYLIYNSLLPLVLLIGFPSFIIKGIRRGGLKRNFRQRFGHFRPEVREAVAGKEAIWIHAVSVGEVFLALKIIEAIHSLRPDQSIVLTTTTTTGYAVASEKTSDSLTVIHNPVDLPWVVSGVLDLVRPKTIVLVESEIWPNLLAAAGKRGIPVKLANARLSPRSGRRYAKFRRLVRPIFSQLEAVSVPFDIDRPRWAAIGIPEDRVSVLGSVKFDQAGGNEISNQKVSSIQNWLRDTGFPPQARILLAGSTHDGEEKLIASVFSKLKETVPDLALVIVPRHAERAGEITSQLLEIGFNALTKAGPDRVESMTEQGSIDPATHVWLANTTGELRAWFHLAEVVIIGKSFCGEGGQNPVEPILAGRSVIVGPKMQNFAEVMDDLVTAKGIRQLDSASDLQPTLLDLFQNAEDGEAMAARGKEAMNRHIGAAERTARFILGES
ncbi:MAG: glycosyltransferase N-terminal domain-containing protein [Verrucomicrobiota bacterium]